jgi:DNA primase
MRCGLTNTVALEGAKVPESIKRLTKEREATALLDGDRGGDLILKELLQVTNIKYIGRAPRGKEIEECNCKEIAEALDNRVPVTELQKQQSSQQQPSNQTQLIQPSQPQKKQQQQQQVPQPDHAPPRPPKKLIPEQIKENVKTLQGTLEAVVLNDKLEQIELLPVSQLAEKLQQSTDVDTVIFDGIITQRIVDIAAEKATKRIVASRVSEAVKPVATVELVTFQETLR